MIPALLQYFLDIFWNFPKSKKNRSNVDPQTTYWSSNPSKDTRDIGTSMFREFWKYCVSNFPIVFPSLLFFQFCMFLCYLLKSCLFVQLPLFCIFGISKFWNFGIYGISNSIFLDLWNLWFCHSLFFVIFKMLTFWKFEMMAFELLLSFEFWFGEFWTLGILQLWISKTYNIE